MTRRPKNSININDFKVKDYRIQKYKDEVGFQYVARDKNDGHIICDHMNRGGFLTSWIRKKYGVDVPSLYERRLYYQMNGDYWWEQWFDILKVPIEVPSIVCPYCDWKCNDASNHSGAYTVHLRDVHNVDFREHLKRFPQDTKFLSKQLDEIKRNELKENEDNYVICPICGEKLFKMTPSHLKHKHNMTMDEFKLRYPNANIMSKMMHEQASESVKLGNMVPRKRIFVSSYEKIIQDMLCENNIEFEANRQILIGKEIDILIPSKRFGIEFDGLLFHSERFGKKDKNYHLDKTNKCNAKGYFLIHVFEDELHGKKDITLRRIKHKLGLNNDLPKVDGRKCLVRNIDIELAKDFVNQNDLAIWNGGDYSIGAFCNDELVGVLVAKDNDKIITHLSTHNKFLCRGVASKLVKTYVRAMRHKEVFVYADKRWTCDGDSNLFTKIGFERLEDIEPRAWFYYPKKFRYLRFPNKLQEDEYDVIFDCGYFSYKFSKGKKPKASERILE